MDDHHHHYFQVVDSQFLVPTLEMHPNGLSYDLANVLSSSSPSFACDLAVAIENIPIMEPIHSTTGEGIATSSGQYDQTHGQQQQYDTPNGALEYMNGPSTSRDADLLDDSSSPTITSSDYSSNYCGKVLQEMTGKEHHDDQEYKSRPEDEMVVTEGLGDGKAASGKSGKKKARIRKRITAVTSRLYVCDWCFGRASFKSCQGLRFHKTLRCPERERKLGNGSDFLLHPLTTLPDGHIHF